LFRYVLLAVFWIVQFASISQAQAETVRNYDLLFDAPPELIALIRAETLLGRWQDRPEFSAEQLDALVFRAKEEVETVLRGQGYFDFEVEVKRQPDISANVVNNFVAKPVVKIEVSAGARTTVNELNFAVTGDALADKELITQLETSWTLQEGSFYRAAVWEQSKKSMLDLLQQKGFLQAMISESKVRVDVRNTTAGVDISFDSGPRHRFGALTVNGLKRYDREIVDALLRFKTGDFYRLDLLIEFQTRLRDSGYFVNASVIPQISEILESRSAGQDLLVPVVVELTERESKRVLVGAGFSTDQGPRVQLGFEHRNLLSHGLQLETGVLLEKVRTRIFGTVRTPLGSDGYYYAFGARYEEFKLSGEEAFKTTVFAHQGRRTTFVDSIFSLQYQSERLLIDRGAGVQVGDKREALTLGYSWNLRRVDSRIDPRVGYTISAQAAIAAKGLASDQSFVRFYARGMNFMPLSESLWPKGATLVTLAELGIVAAPSRQGIPSDNLFRAGGAQSVRGYRYLTLGAKDGIATVGGRYLAVASAEYQQPVYRNILAAAFVDVGDAGDSTAQMKARVGTGVGLRWRSPIGPVNIDAAYGLAEKAWRLHLSVGYSF
jgi:translocation and assembly module TamA